MFFGSHFGPPSNDTKPGLVSVAITLRPAAAEVSISVLLASLPPAFIEDQQGGNGLGPFLMFVGYCW